MSNSETFLDDQTVTAQDLNNIAVDLGYADYSHFPETPPQSAVSALNQITADLVLSFEKGKSMIYVNKSSDHKILHYDSRGMNYIEIQENTVSVIPINRADFQKGGDTPLSLAVNRAKEGKSKIYAVCLISSGLIFIKRLVVGFIVVSDIISGSFSPRPFER